MNSDPKEKKQGLRVTVRRDILRESVVIQWQDIDNDRNENILKIFRVVRMFLTLWNYLKGDSKERSHYFQFLESISFSRAPCLDQSREAQCLFQVYITQWVCYIPFKFLKPSMSITLIKPFTARLPSPPAIFITPSEEELTLLQFNLTFSTCSNNIVLTFSLQTRPQNALSHTLHQCFILASRCLSSPSYKLCQSTNTFILLCHLLLNSLCSDFLFQKDEKCTCNHQIQ